MADCSGHKAAHIAFTGRPHGLPARKPPFLKRIQGKATARSAQPVLRARRRRRINLYPSRTTGPTRVSAAAPGGSVSAGTTQAFAFAQVCALAATEAGVYRYTTFSCRKLTFTEPCDTAAHKQATNAHSPEISGYRARSRRTTGFRLQLVQRLVT